MVREGDPRRYGSDRRQRADNGHLTRGRGSALDGLLGQRPQLGEWRSARGRPSFLGDAVFARQRDDLIKELPRERANIELSFRPIGSCRRGSATC